jgi:hypothetical protein
MTPRPAAQKATREKAGFVSSMKGLTMSTEATKDTIKQRPAPASPQHKDVTSDVMDTSSRLMLSTLRGQARP